MKRTFICLLGAFALATAMAATARASQTEITASGSGSVSLPPDMATISASVETNAENGDDAISRNNAAYDRIVAALSKIGIARADVTLSYYNVSYNPRPAGGAGNSGERYGYTVSRNFAVKVRDIGSAGRVSDACIASGATGINGVSFGLSNPSAARAQAIVIAVAAARANAEALAKASELHIVSMKSIELGGAEGPVPVPLGAMARMNVPTQFDQSNVNVNVSVSAIFLAEP
jgi:uncharacterized protein